MSSSTALLPKPKKDDHPIFLRVCHSPWLGITQKGLLYARGVTFLYLVGSFATVLFYDFKYTDKEWLVAFELSKLSYVLQIIYSGIVTLWTFMHLHYPHHGSQSPSNSARIQAFLSPPRTNTTTGNRVFFSIFYSAAITYPFVVTIIHWAVVVPHYRTPVDDIFNQGCLKTFTIVTLYIVNSVIALGEVFCFSSIKRQNPVWAHIGGLSVLSLVYVAWENAGKDITGKFAYYFFDYSIKENQKIAMAIFAFAGLADTVFVATYVVTALREILTTQCQGKSHGYARLPQ